MAWPARLRTFSLICGTVLASSGAITAYLGTLGGARWVSAIFGVVGILQIISTDIVTATTQSTNQ